MFIVKIKTSMPNTAFYIILEGRTLPLALQESAGDTTNAEHGNGVFVLKPPGFI